MSNKWSFALFLAAIALFVGGALVADEHIPYGNPEVLVDFGLASLAGGFWVKEVN